MAFYGNGQYREMAMYENGPFDTDLPTTYLVQHFCQIYGYRYILYQEYDEYDLKLV